MKRTRLARALFNAASITAMTAALAGLATNTSAAPAVFFNGDLTVGEQSFISVVNKADAAYNAANPGANYASTVFKLHLDDNPDGKYSVTVGGTTVYVKTTLAGAPATNSGTGDNGTTGFTDWDVGYTSGDWTSAVAGGYTISFFSDSAYATEFKINAIGFNVTNWGTCCATGNVKPDNSLADASQIYMLFNGTPRWSAASRTPYRAPSISSPAWTIAASSAASPWSRTATAKPSAPAATLSSRYCN